MAATLCASCHARKGRRPCPALLGPICSPCCGAKRLVEIPCPSDCGYLEQNEAWQGAKRLHAGGGLRDRYQQADSAGREVLEWTLAVDSQVAGFLREDPDASAAEVLGGLRFARARLSPILTPGSAAPASRFESRMLRAIEAWKETAGSGTARWDSLPGALDSAIRFYEEALREPAAIRDVRRQLLGLFAERPDEGRQEPGSEPPAPSRIVIP